MASLGLNRYGCRNRCHRPREDRRERRPGRGLRDFGPGPDQRPVRNGGSVPRRGAQLQPGRGQNHPLARRLGRRPQRRAAVRVRGKRPEVRLQRSVTSVIVRVNVTYWNKRADRTFVFRRISVLETPVRSYTVFTNNLGVIARFKTP